MDTDLADIAEKRTPYSERQCAAPGCQRRGYCRSLCQPCYRRFMKQQVEQQQTDSK